MRTFQLRIYTLQTDEALRTYARAIHPRHLRSMRCWGFWTKKEDAAPRLFALVSYAEGDDPGEVDKRYLQSAEHAQDVEGFDTNDITGVETTILIPSTGSPLQ